MDFSVNYKNYLNLEYINKITDINGNPIENINKNTVGYIKYKNLGMHYDEAMEELLYFDTEHNLHLNCMTIVWDSDISTFAPDMNDWRLTTVSHSCDGNSIFYVGYLKDYEENLTWVKIHNGTSDATSYDMFSRTLPLVIEFYYIEEEYENHDECLMVIDFDNANLNANVLENSSLYVVQTEQNQFKNIYFSDIYSLEDFIQPKLLGNVGINKDTVFEAI